MWKNEKNVKKEAILKKKTHYLVNGESDQKSVTNKKDAKSHFLSEVCPQI